MSQLRFRSIAISNFKTFTGDHQFDLERKPGLYYVTGVNKVAPELGANGVGKSTIWDALLWVLWGRTGRDNRPADAIKPWEGKGQTDVVLQFERNGEQQVIQRARSPNRLVHSIVDGSLWVSKKDITQDEIPKLLGMSEEMFRRTLVLGQFGALFLDLKPEAQAQMFTEALQLDVWLRAIEVASNAAKASQRIADQAAGDIKTNEALLATLATDLADYKEKAQVFEVDKAQRLAKGQKGIDQLLADIEEADDEQPDRPTAPSSKELDALKEKRAPLRQDIAVLLRDVQHSRQEHADLNKQIKAFNTQKVKTCPTCNQPLSNKDAVKRLETLTANAMAQQEVINNQEAETATLQKQVDSFVGKIEVAQAEYDKLVNSFDARMAKWDTWNKKMAALRGELTRWQDNLKRVQAETNQAAAEADRLTKRRTTLRAQALDLKQEQEDALAEVEQAKFWQDGFREIRLSIIDQTLLELEIAASRHASMLGLNDWGIKFDTERETKSGTVSYAFSVLLYPPGQDTPVKWESYSGGESQRWQLATSFALSEVLLARAGIVPNLEVLDEPTRGLSSQGVSDLLDVLSDRARELGRAIYFVDHHSLDKGSFDGTLVVTKTKKGSTFAWQ